MSDIFPPQFTIIKKPLLPESIVSQSIIYLKAGRQTLAKRRWRAAAEDGKEFGFDLEKPLAHGDSFWEIPHKTYQIQQQPESLLQIALPATPSEGALLGWTLGNLHLETQITGICLLLPDDTALRLTLQRAHLTFSVVHSLFLPNCRAGQSHHHESHTSHSHHHHGHSHEK